MEKVKAPTVQGRTAAIYSIAPSVCSLAPSARMVKKWSYGPEKIYLEQSNPAGAVDQGGIGFELLLGKPCRGGRRRGPIPRKARANMKTWRTSENQVQKLNSLGGRGGRRENTIWLDYFEQTFLSRSTSVRRSVILFTSGKKKKGSEFDKIIRMPEVIRRENKCQTKCHRGGVHIKQSQLFVSPFSENKMCSSWMCE
ncbi:hypothetical protein TNCV_1257261 [Trichonephila clavipes]|nr:hypothetical protein TNCV_1257261 [Trichonephila clavipes]